MSAGKDLTEERVRCFDLLFHEHQRVLYAYLFGQTSRREHAEDLLQQVFVRVWRHIDEVIEMPPTKVKPWLFAIAGNLATDHRRRESVRIQAIQTETEVTSSEKMPDQEAELRDSMAKLNIAIANLPDEIRTAFTMTVLGDMSSEEVGQTLGKPAGTIRYLVSEARKRLAREVEL